MVFSPDSIVYLLNVPFEQDQKNQLYFTSIEAQVNYFLSRRVKTYDGLTYQRKDNAIRVPDNIEHLYNCNYVMYRNSNFSDKWFYAFITNLEYSNPNMTYAYIKTDVYQTWRFDITIKPSFVDREHILSDTPGNNVVPESFDLGEYITQSRTQIFDTNVVGQNCCVLVLTPQSTKRTVALNLSAYESGDAVITGSLDDDNIPTEFKQYGYGFVTPFQYEFYSLNLGGLLALQQKINSLVGEGQAARVQGIYICPKQVYNIASNDNKAQLTPAIKQTGFIDIALGTQTRPTHLDNYTPKNQKLFTYPYCFQYLSNNRGQYEIYKYEYSRLENGQLNFAAISSYTPAPAVKIFEPQYNQNSHISYNIDDINIINCNVDNGVSVTYNTQVPITYNEYQNYYNGHLVSERLGAQINRISYFSNIAKSIVSPIASAASGDIGGAIGGAINAGANIISNEMRIQSEVAQKQEALISPQNVLGISSATDALMNTNCNSAATGVQCIRARTAKIIDDFFDMYGYKTNQVKIPNMGTRPYWNYVKTIGINIEGALPNDDLEELKRIFDAGITLWNNPDYIYDYSKNNH